MDIFIKGKGAVKLTQKEFKASGGEGSVYVKGKTAFKIYNDPKKMIPVGKIQELSSLTMPTIIKPEDTLLDSKNSPIGYTMQALSDTMALCAMFPKAYRDRNKITPDMAINLVKKLQEGVSHCHANKILIVDLNEMNFLINKGHDELFFIDVDSYQTPHYSATALMESVRDRHSKTFSELTDWFSFGIVSFQMFVGIHPYKGKHNTVKGLDERMLSNISVFNKDVSIPGACLPFDVIPQAYKDWYEAVFERGARIAPPDSLIPVIVVNPRVKKITGSQTFDISQILVADGDIIYVCDNVIVSNNGIYNNTRKILSPTDNVNIAVTPKMNRIITAKLHMGQLKLYDGFFAKEIPVSLYADEIMSYDGRLYTKHDTNLYEIEFIDLPTSTMAAAKHVGNVLPQATQLFEGVAIQSILGAYYASLLAGSGKCYQCQIKELNGYRVVDAKLDKNVLIIVAEKSGQYDKFIFRFDEHYQTYDLRLSQDTGTLNVNFIVLDSGVVLHMNENEELELFSKNKGSNNVKLISDPAITGDCILFKNGGQACFAKDDTLYRFTMK